jgi:hypothetical protein
MESHRPPFREFCAWFLGFSLAVPAAMLIALGLMMVLREVPVPRGAAAIAVLLGKLVSCALLAGLVWGLRFALNEAPSEEAKAGGLSGAILGSGVFAYCWFTIFN